MADKKDNPLQGITVNGQGLAAVIEQQQAAAVDRLLRQQIADQRRILRRAAIAPSAAPKRYTNYVRHSRTKRLPKEQIRKEYGIMSSPHPTITANILDTLRLSPTPLGNEEIAATLHLPALKVTQHTSTCFRHLKGLDGISVTDDPQGRRLFNISEQWALEDLLQVVREGKRKQKQKRSPTTSTESDRFCQHHSPAFSDTLNTLSSQLLSQALGVKVEVSGRVEIVIKFER